jgi:hypothetical protein
LRAVKSGYSRNWKKGIVKNGGTLAPVVSIRWQTIGDWLAVTPDEAAQLEKIPAARQFSPHEFATDSGPSRGATRAAAKRHRQEIVADLVRQLGIPPERHMAGLPEGSGLGRL